MVKYCDKEVLVELTSTWKLLSDLPHTINKLEEYGCPLIITVFTITMPISLAQQRHHWVIWICSEVRDFGDNYTMKYWKIVLVSQLYKILKLCKFQF
jgi:hypothetical protein